MIRTYTDLKEFKTFLQRYNYLRLTGQVGESTFGFDRYLNQMLYRSKRWRYLRDEIIIRDEGCDLGVPGYEIFDKVIIHHMNPLAVADITQRNGRIFNPEELICVSHNTHLAIHYGDSDKLPKPPVVRYPGDTKLW